MDEYTVAAGILHDIEELSDFTLEDLEQEIHPKVFNKIQGITKLKTFTTKRSDAIYYERIRNLLVTAVNDPSVVVIRLAEKLHNLQTIKALPRKDQIKIAEKALHIYAPLAEQIGMQKLKRELDNHAFKVIDPKTYENISSFYSDKLASEQDLVDKFTKELQKIADKVGISDAVVYGRQKHVYSIYRKWKSPKYKNKPLSKFLEDLHDHIAFTILTNTQEECYAVLSELHASYDFLPEELDDYIKNPKPNGYRAIQTTILIRPDLKAEVQIKTKQMHEYNEYGPASHIFYKLYGSKKRPSDVRIKHMKALMQWRQNALDNPETEINEALESPHIYVLTPKGDIKELPKDSTPIDFAYKVHTTLGDRLKRAYVNDKLVPLTYKLKTGDVCRIEAFANKNTVNPDWLRIAKTAFARNCIRKALSKTRP